MTMEKTKKLSLFLLTLVLVGSVSFVCFAKSKTPIKSCAITVTGLPVVGEILGEDSLSVSVSGSGCSLSDYEETNEQFAWEGGEIPEITIYISAKDGYYFAITKASQIKLKGCTFVSAARQDSATTLVVKVKLDKVVGYAIEEVEEATISDKLICTWTPVENAGSYEVRFMRENAIVGGIQTTTETRFDASSNVTKAGRYHFKVRAVHKDDSNAKGEWKESNDVFITEYEAKAYKEAAEVAESAGEWITDKKGTKFKLPNGTFVTNNWRKINKKWYYFKADGYRASGWTQIDGAHYYFDPTSGEMVVNTVIDGYEIAIDGRRIE